MTRAATNLRSVIPVVFVVALVAAFFAVRSGHASPTASVRVVRVANNPTLHEKVLVNHKGLTLYSLSAEKSGRFICTDSLCRSLWTPLVVAKGATPIGATHLGTIRRPDGRMQVSYRGLPVYTFKEDRKPGDVMGNGFKDVGIWRPALVAASASASPPVSTNPYPSYPGYGG